MKVIAITFHIVQGLLDDLIVSIYIIEDGPVDITHKKAI